MPNFLKTARSRAALRNEQYLPLIINHTWYVSSRGCCPISQSMGLWGGMLWSWNPASHLTVIAAHSICCSALCLPRSRGFQDFIRLRWKIEFCVGSIQNILQADGLQYLCCCEGGLVGVPAWKVHLSSAIRRRRSKNETVGREKWKNKGVIFEVSFKDLRNSHEGSGPAGERRRAAKGYWTRRGEAARATASPEQHNPLGVDRATWCWQTAQNGVIVHRSLTREFYGLGFFFSLLSYCFKTYKDLVIFEASVKHD